jgi:hypothetical protein
MRSGPDLITETERIDQIKASELSASDREVLEQDRARLARLGGGAHLNEWLEFHPGLEIRRSLAMRLAFTNEPKGKNYTHELNQLYAADGFDVTDKMLMKTLSDVLWLGDKHNPERMAILDELRAGMTPGERARLNSPRSARQRVQAELKARAARAQGDAPQKEHVSPLEQAKRRIAQLEHELAQACAELARKQDGSLFDLKHDTPDDIITAMQANISSYKFDAIINTGVERKRRKQQRPAG